MPTVDVAMARSLQSGALDTITEIWGTKVSTRDTISDVQAKANEAANALSSWDGCMSVSYCKWPVIAGIVVGGLIILSIVLGIIRCACCGVSCCCSCCSCLKCCGSCCGLCDPPKGRPHKYLDNETAPPNRGYRPEPPMKAPMMSPGLPGATRMGGGAVGGGHYAPEPPQYAEFDVSRKAHGGEDSLPAMPSWNEAASKKVLVDDEPVEMNQLDKSGVTAGPSAAGSTAAVSAMAGGAAMSGVLSPPSSHHSPAVSPGPGGRSPYRQPSPAASGYFAQGQQPHQADPYARNDSGYNVGGHGTLNGAMSVAGAGAMGRNSPYQHLPQQDAYGRGYGQDQHGYDSTSHSPYASNTASPYGPPQGQNYNSRGPSPPRSNTYGSGPSRDNYGYEQQRQSPPPQQGGGYGYSSTGRQHQQQYSPSHPQQQHYQSHEDYEKGLQNNSGFDFNSGFSRPAQEPQHADSPGSGGQYGRGPSPPRRQHTGDGRGDYQPYRPYPGHQNSGY